MKLIFVDISRNAIFVTFMDRGKGIENVGVMKGRMIVGIVKGGKFVDRVKERKSVGRGKGRKNVEIVKERLMWRGLSRWRRGDLCSMRSLMCGCFGG